MPRNAVQIVVDGMETVLSEGIGVFVKSSAQKLLSEEPKEMVIGQRLNKVVKSGISILEPSTLQNVLSETLDHMKTLKSDNKVIQNFIQGTYWQSRAPLMDELNFLQETGIEISTPDYEGKLYFELGLILGDNLGLHSITGFTESFSSNFPCRMCTMRKEDMWVQCYEDESLLRHTDQYYAQLSLNDVSATGVREECIWFSVNNFNLFDQLGVDVMHDMLEGCSKYIMSFILKYYIKELKLFTLQVLNDRLFCFDYGPENNKPCALTEDYIIQGNIRQSASEMLTFVRYFGLLVGDFVPSEEPVWGLYIAMRRVIDVILSTSLELDSCSMLQTLVAEMNDLYLKYSKNRLKPKFHFLTHYHSFIKKFGPVIHLWSMRYEAKHKVSKISARSSFNRRNICKTLAIKHQLKLNETFINGKLCNKIKVGPQTELDSIKQHQIQNELNLNVEDSIFRVNWAEVGGTRYKPKTILTLGILDDNNPQFAIVKNVFLYAENRVIFECNILTTIGFDEHVYCYEITLPETDIIRYVFQDLLLSHVPNTLNVVSNGTKYITVRSPF
ncbi:uncharacterized protein LOC103311882 [Acyrthosiphon pisum]|uniref:Uncharacterized protein n=1 Tax=Acyrthosiphon pisum TaxID=7029 RepID=A0A8R2FDV3_ACYPI|nr:uncharacterized protein LOC103311882 [Acyrthosiphon pisum]|eukprot:XP_008189915.1 PREDICTED: uncharacterized protein LOC103311882 [Acyrthosiphon pisum]